MYYGDKAVGHNVLQGMMGKMETEREVASNTQSNSTQNNSLTF